MGAYMRNIGKIKIFNTEMIYQTQLEVVDEREIIDYPTDRVFGIEVLKIGGKEDDSAEKFDIIGYKVRAFSWRVGDDPNRSRSYLNLAMYGDFLFVNQQDAVGLVEAVESIIEYMCELE